MAGCGCAVAICTLPGKIVCIVQKERKIETYRVENC